MLNVSPTAVYASAAIVDQGAAIDRVLHEIADGAWLLLAADDDDAPLLPTTLDAVPLDAADRAELADLPPGWAARRTSEHVWARYPLCR